MQNAKDSKDDRVINLLEKMMDRFSSIEVRLSEKADGKFGFVHIIEAHHTWENSVYT